MSKNKGKIMNVMSVYLFSKMILKFQLHEQNAIIFSTQIVLDNGFNQDTTNAQLVELSYIENDVKNKIFTLTLFI